MYVEVQMWRQTSERLRDYLGRLKVAETQAEFRLGQAASNIPRQKRECYFAVAGLNLERRRELLTTVTELNAMAPAARNGR